MVKLVLRPTAATTHGVIENTHITAQTPHTYIYTHTTVHTQANDGEIDSICVIISAVAGATPRPVKYATLTGFICFYCYCILGRINPRHFEPPFTPAPTQQHLPHLPQSQQPGARARASAFCAAVSGSCTSFAALICRSLIYLAIHSYIRVYRSTKSKARPSARPDL